MTANNGAVPTTVVSVENINVNVTSFAAVTFDADKITGTGATITVNNLQTAGTTAANVSNVATGATVKAGTGVTGTLTVDSADGVVTINAGDATGVTVTDATSATITATKATAFSLDGTTGTDSAKVIAGVAYATLETASAQQVENLTLEGSGAAVTFDLDTTGDAPTSYTMTGSQSVTIATAAAQLGNTTTSKTLTDSTTAGTTTVQIKSNTGATFVVDKIAADVIQLGGMLNGSATTLTTGATYVLANSQNVKLAGDAAILTLQSASTTDTAETLNLTVAASQTSTGTTVSDFETVNLVVDDGATTKGTVTIANLVGTSATGGVINVTGADNLTLTDATATFINASGLTGSLTATIAADLLKVTGGTANDTFNAIAANFTVDGTSGDSDNLAFAAVTDLSNNTVSIANIDLITINAGGAAGDATETVTMLSKVVSGQSWIVKGTGATNMDTLSVSMNDTSVDLSKLVVDTTTANVTITNGNVNALSQTITGSNGADTLTSTGAGAINMSSGAGNDVITTAGGVDTINGEAGDDNITTGAGNDTITGGEGADTITGGAGNDTLTGGAGSDQFVMLTATIASGNDTITDFTTGVGGDAIDLGYLTIPASLTAVAMTQSATIATNAIYTVNYGGAIGTTDFTVAGATGFDKLFGAGKALGTTVATTDDFMVIVQGTDKTVILAFENPAATTLANTDIDAVVTLSGVTSANAFDIANFM